MMQTDVKAVHLDASGVAVVGPTRIKGYQLAPGGTAGEIQFFDSATTNSGQNRLTVHVTTNTVVVSTLIPGEGIKYDKGCYIVLPTAASITVFYG